MQTKKQAGFTLIELMIVVAIVGILAAVAIPAYQDYIKRSKMSEVMATAGACKTSISEYAASNNELPATTASAGCSSGSQYVADLQVATGVITVTSQNIGTGADGQAVLLTPVTSTGAAVTNANPDQIGGWNCTNAGGVESEYLPANCR
ncbi:pilin [Kangiella shandongensis]|uniref:pilin n=1 Tax=Kangiella shandongensis TaxID=2763258 RepID=UPI0022A6A728|nr:pilin [Kangiella shandongensis]